MTSFRISSTVEIDEAELQEQFIQAGGPGGQNVNKVATAVQLKFDVERSTSIPKSAKNKLAALAGRRLSAAGVLTITAREHRSQQLNRAAARERLFELLRKATERSKTRIKTKPTRAAKRKRMESKGQRGATKKMRQKPSLD
jgi:ribosome-associated protein